jgi:glycosyltransferase involved in cell wall biosynthesis
MRFVFVSAMSPYPWFEAKSWWGGSEELWSQAALHLRNQGHQVFVLVPWWPQPAPQLLTLSQHGISVRMCTPKATGLGRRLWRKVRRCLNQRSQRSEDLNWLLQQRPDFVCVSNGVYSDGLSYLEFCVEHDLPYASVVQANLEFLFPDDRGAERLIRVYQKARRSFFVSYSNRELLETQLGITLANSEVVRNPFNVRWNASVPWPSESEGWRLACEARFEPPAKGQDILFQVMASEAWRSKPIRVSLFGKGHMEEGMRRLATRLSLDGRISFCGHLSNIEKIWADHHALVLPSRYEGLPLALVEAMLCARPAIVTDVGGNAELVEDGISGFVATAPTTRHLAEAMERAWEHRAQWKDMGAAARTTVKAKVCEKPAQIFAEKLLRLAQ